MDGRLEAKVKTLVMELAREEQARLTGLEFPWLGAEI